MALIPPPLRRTAADAAQFASIVHDAQTDKAGRPYVEHLGRVAARVFALSAGCPFWNEEEVDEACQIAWLHDVIEDGRATREILAQEEFGRNVRVGADDLSKTGVKLSYSDWIGFICSECELSVILVKLADVEDNSNPERLALLPAKTRERLQRKYAGAADLLREAARAKGWQG